MHSFIHYFTYRLMSAAILEIKEIKLTIQVLLCLGNREKMMTKKDLLTDGELKSDWLVPKFLVNHGGFKDCGKEEEIILPSRGSLSWLK